MNTVILDYHVQTRLKASTPLCLRVLPSRVSRRSSEYYGNCHIADSSILLKQSPVKGTNRQSRHDNWRCLEFTYLALPQDVSDCLHFDSSTLISCYGQ